MIRKEKNVTVFNGKDLSIGAREVVCNKLFDIDGALSSIMLHIIEGLHTTSKVEISIYRYVTDSGWHSVAVGFRRNDTVMAYCAPRYRRRGFATKCISALKLHRKTIAYSTKDKEFWNHQRKKITVIK